MSASGQKRKNENKTESTHKRRRYKSPPPVSSSPSTTQTIFLLQRNISEKERCNIIPLSPTIPMKFALTNRTIVNFGRDPKNELVLNSSRILISKGKEYSNGNLVSREHGKFVFHNNQWFIVDKKSTNGIFVNNTQIRRNQEHPLDIEDEIVIGRNVKDTEFKYIFTMKSHASAPPTPRTPLSGRSRSDSYSQITETPQFESQNSQSQSSQRTQSYDADGLQAMLATFTNNMLQEQQKQFDAVMKKKEAEQDELRLKLQQKTLAEIAAKEEENKKKQRELTEKAEELNKQKEELKRKQTEKEREIQIEKEKIAQQIQQQNDELRKKQEIETEKLDEREAAAKKKLEELKKQQNEIDARDKKQRERNEIEHKKWVEKQAQLSQEKKKMEQKEREIKQKEDKVKQEMEEQQQSMEEEITCCICCDLLVASRSLECGHSSCHQCLDQWMREQKTCPSCRNAINRDPVPCFVVDNLISDTYLKDKSEEDRQEYKERKREYEIWKKRKEEEKKKEEEEKRRATAAAAAAAVAARYNPIDRWNGGWGNNNRRHGGGNNVVWNNAVNNNVNNLNSNVLVRSNPFAQPAAVLPLIANNNMRLNQRIVHQAPQQQQQQIHIPNIRQQVLRPNNMQHNAQNNVEIMRAGSRIDIDLSLSSDEE